VGCTASLHSLATFLFKSLLFPEESPWNVKCQPDWTRSALLPSTASSALPLGNSLEARRTRLLSSKGLSTPRRRSV
jgi:hypothetical protein